MAQTSVIVDLKDGLLSNRAWALKNQVVNPYFPCKHNTQCIDELELTWRLGDSVFFRWCHSAQALLVRSLSKFSTLGLAVHLEWPNLMVRPWSVNYTSRFLLRSDIETDNLKIKEIAYLVCFFWLVRCKIQISDSLLSLLKALLCFCPLFARRYGKGPITSTARAPRVRGVIQRWQNSGIRAETSECTCKYHENAWKSLKFHFF